MIFVTYVQRTMDYTLHKGNLPSAITEKLKLAYTLLDRDQV